MRHKSDKNIHTYVVVDMINRHNSSNKRALWNNLVTGWAVACDDMIATPLINDKR